MTVWVTLAYGHWYKWTGAEAPASPLRCPTCRQSDEVLDMVPVSVTAS